MIDNAYSIEEVAKFMDIKPESVKQLADGNKLPFPLTPITLGERNIFCVLKKHWNDALEVNGKEAMRQLKTDQKNLNYRG